MFTPRLFLVRVWQQSIPRGGSAFRASVRAPTDEAARLFTRADALVRFLEEQSLLQQVDEPTDTKRKRTPIERTP